MSLAAGTRVGSYEVLGALGAGGMGEVYRARDTKLKRDVALKVLPPDVAEDPARLARFQREAETLASLNHPNIAQIYGVEDRALVSTAVGKDGSIIVPLASPESWFWPLGVVDPNTGRTRVLDLGRPDSDMAGGWTPDGKLLINAMGVRSTMWRFVPVTAAK